MTSPAAAPITGACTLNAVVAEIDLGASVDVGYQPYVYRDDLDKLWREHRGTHLFKRHDNTILSISVVRGLAPIGEVRRVRLRDVRSLVAPLVMDALLRYFLAQHRRVRRHRPLDVVSARVDDQLLSRAVGAGALLPDWLEQRVNYVFETRLAFQDGQVPSVLLACDARSCITIEANGAQLLAAGIPLEGRYVTVRSASESAGDPRLTAKPQLVGRVVGVLGDQVKLADCGEGPNTRQLTEVSLENRRENLAHCLRHILPSKAEAALTRLESLVAENGRGPQRFQRIAAMLGHLQKQPLEAVPGVAVNLSNLLKPGTRTPWTPVQQSLSRPALVFDPGGRKTDTWNERGLDKYGPYDRASFLKDAPRIAVVCQRRARAKVEQFVTRLVDGMPEVDIRGRKPYGRGLVARYGLRPPVVEFFEAQDASAASYRKACLAALEHATDRQEPWQLALVQIDDASHLLTGADDPYLVSKSAFMKRQVPVQEVTLEKMTTSPRDLVYILSDISLGVYAKLGGVPWVLPTGGKATHEVVLGLGSYTSSESRLGSKERVVGVTTAFSIDGRYLLESRTAAVPYDDYAAAVLSTLRLAVQTIRQEQHWQPNESVRFVVHAFKPIKDNEVTAIEQLITELGIRNATFAFLHVADDHPFLVFDEAAQGSGSRGLQKGAFVPERGIAMPFGRDEWALTLTGPRELKQASAGLPSPVLAKLHRRSTFKDMDYLMRQLFAFSCHSWRGFGLSSMPVTIQYSAQIARVLRKLDSVPDWDREAMVGQIGRTRWFL